LSLLFFIPVRRHDGLILRTAKVGTYFLIFKGLGEKVFGLVVKVKKVVRVVVVVRVLSHQLPLCQCRAQSNRGLCKPAICL